MTDIIPEPKNFVVVNLGGFYYFSCFNTACTDIYFSDTALFNNRTNPLKIRIKSSLVQVVGMTDIIANQRFFSANSTFF